MRGAGVRVGYLLCLLGVSCADGPKLDPALAAPFRPRAHYDPAETLHDAAAPSQDQAGTLRDAAAPLQESTGTPPVPISRSLRVMTFNVLVGGTTVDFGKVVEAIEVSGADVVALQETFGRADLLAAELGWPYVSKGTDVISRFPIVAPPTAEGRYVWIEIEPGQVVALSNVHLPSSPYAPYFTALCPASALLQLERERRLPELTPLLERLTPLAAQAMPVFLVGDFNVPSHLDWTLETVRVRSQIVYPVRWPVSAALEGLGFIDSYRAVHPDAKVSPGLTWWAGRTNTDDAGRAGEPQDRIDLVLSSGPARVDDSQIVGEAGAAGVDIGVSPWPSDHRAVVSTFTVTPALAPTFVSADQRLVTMGDPVRVRFYAHGSSAERIVLSPQGGSPSAGRSSALSESQFGPGTVRAGSIELSTSEERAGAYDLSLLSSEGEILAQNTLWLADPGAQTEISVDRAVYDSGEPIRVSWGGGAGYRSDWVAVCRASLPTRNNCFVREHVDAQVEGSVMLDGHSIDGETWPLAAGDYEAIYFSYGSYQVAARASFRVQGDRAEPERPAWDAACTGAVP
jgi:exonuclease III